MTTRQISTATWAGSLPDNLSYLAPTQFELLVKKLPLPRETRRSERGRERIGCGDFEWETGEERVDARVGELLFFTTG